MGDGSFLRYRGELHRVPRAAGREVIIAASAFNAPKLLMLSGIGDPDALRAHGIKTKVALKGVGKNLQDHVTAMISSARNAPAATCCAMRRVR